MHTKEPWSVDDDHQVFAESIGEYVAITKVEEFSKVPQKVVKANARRIVACVNALSHIETQTLETLVRNGIKLTVPNEQKLDKHKGAAMPTLDSALNQRIVERLEHGEWVRVSMLALSVGDRFRMFDPVDGDQLKPVVSTDGSTEWVVADSPAVDNGVACVCVEQPQPKSMSATVVPNVDSLTGKFKVDSNTFEHDYIILLIDAFAAEIGVKDVSAEVVDKYALAITSFMRGQTFNGEVITTSEIKAILESKVDALKSLKD